MVNTITRLSTAKFNTQFERIYINMLGEEELLNAIRGRLLMSILTYCSKVGKDTQPYFDIVFKDINDENYITWMNATINFGFIDRYLDLVSLELQMEALTVESIHKRVKHSTEEGTKKLISDAIDGIQPESKTLPKSKRPLRRLCVDTSIVEALPTIDRFIPELQTTIPAFEERHAKHTGFMRSLFGHAERVIAVPGEDANCDVAVCDQPIDELSTPSCTVFCGGNTLVMTPWNITKEQICEPQYEEDLFPFKAAVQGNLIDDLEDFSTNLLEPLNSTEKAILDDQSYSYWKGMIEFADGIEKDNYSKVQLTLIKHPNYNIHFIVGTFRATGYKSKPYRPVFIIAPERMNREILDFISNKYFQSIEVERQKVYSNCDVVEEAKELKDAGTHLATRLSKPMYDKLEEIYEKIGHSQ